MGVALDEPKEGDLREEIDGIQFVMQDKLAKEVKDVKVDYKVSIAGKNFVVTSSSRGDVCSLRDYNK